jgi:hypothetical protein
VQKSAKATIVSWASHRIKRVVKSTLAAEAAALSEAQDQLEYARVLFMQMLGKVDGRNWQEALKMPGYLVMDAKSLYDSLMKPGSMLTEQRVALDLAADPGGLGTRDRLRKVDLYETHVGRCAYEGDDQGAAVLGVRLDQRACQLGGER